jgi:hypothetical protein
MVTSITISKMKVVVDHLISLPSWTI